jgi:endonuclease/exonuclease/phosphatase family metal-dependent hydrolase
MGYGSNQLTEVRAVLDMVAQRSGGWPTVIVGDFNSQPGSPVYQAMLAAGVVDIYAGQDALSTARFAHLRVHLDHIFATPSLEWAGCAVLGAPFSALSDHAPKVATLRLRS